MGHTGIMRQRPSLIDDAQGCATVRALRWPEGLWCPRGRRGERTKQGRDDTQPERQRSRGQSGERRLDEVTETLCAGHPPPLRVWRRCRYGLGRTRSTHPMAHARARKQDDGQPMPGP